MPNSATPGSAADTLTFSSPCIFPFTVGNVTSDSCTNVGELDPDNYWCGTGQGTWGYCNTTSPNCPLASIPTLNPFGIRVQILYNTEFSKS